MKNKQIVIRFLVLFIVLFAVGAAIEWIDLEVTYRKCLNKEYSTVISSDGKDFNDFMMEVNKEFTLEYRFKSMLNCGIFYSFWGTVISLYMYNMYKLITSKIRHRKIVGYIMATIAILIPIIWVMILNIVY